MSRPPETSHGATPTYTRLLCTIPDTMKAQTEGSGLTSHSMYYFRFSTFTRAGQQGYSQVVSLFVN